MRSAIEDASNSLLGAPNRLFIAAAVASFETAEFTNKDLLQHLGAGSWTLSRNLQHFVDAGILERLAVGHYRRLSSAYWGMCRTLLAELMDRYTVPKLVVTDAAGD